MNIEDIKLKIKEIHNKIKEQEERLFNNENPFSTLDLDTQMMYIRILYDQYLVLQQYYFKQINPVAEETNESLDLFSDNNPSEEVKPPINQLSMESLFDFENENITSPSKIEKETESQPFVIEPKEQPIETVKEEPVIETIKNSEEESVKEEEEIVPDVVINTIQAEKAEIPIEIDIDNIEFVEDDEDDEEIIQPPKQESYNKSFFPQINPMIDDKEPDIAIPTTKEALEKTASAMYPSNTVGEAYNTNKKEINEQFSNQTDNNIANRFQKTQFNDLMKAIDINDKFLFIRELFNGNGSLFTEVVNQLNQLSKLTDAIDYFEKTKTTYRWKENSEAYIKLYELILKKYSK